MIKKILHRINSIDLDDDATVSRMSLSIIFIAVFIVFILSFCTEDDTMRNYLQNDKDWADIEFSGGIICNDGCGICCACSIISALSETVYPDEMAALYDRSFPEQDIKGTNPDFFRILAKQYGLQYSKCDYNDVDTKLSEGWLIIADVPKGCINNKSRHYIVVYSANGKKYKVVNPSSNAIAYKSVNKSDLKTSTLYCFRGGN